MIGEDRLALNHRFIQVFNMLIDKGEIVLNDRSGKGMGDFAERIIGNRAYGHIVRAYLDENDKRVIDYKHISNLCKEFGINESYMLKGIGTPFGKTEKQTDKTEYNSNHNSPKSNIIYTNVKAFAGSQVDVDSFNVEDNATFSIPGMNGSGYVAFPIEGNSMEPIIDNGDIVICKELNSISDIKDNEIYAIKNNGQVWVKYVQKIFLNQKSKVVPHKLKLISANYLEHDPFEEEINNSTKLYKVVRKISKI